MSSSSLTDPALCEVLDALKTPWLPAESSARGPESSPCTICRVVAASVDRCLKAFFFELLNDPESRLKLRSSRGFCRAHIAAAGAAGDALGLAILYGDLATSAIKASAPNKLGIGRKRPAGCCPACRLETEADARYTGALADGLNEAQVRDAVAAGTPLCVVHTEMVVCAADKRRGLEFKAVQERKITELIAELEEIVRKHDYRFRDEKWGPEKDAWIRAMALIGRQR